MIVTTEGIVFRQVKTVNGRRMILLFSKSYGKISAGTGISEKTRGKSSLAIKPFTYGRYELYKGRESYSINGGETIRSFYSLGEDIDKYMNASYVMELTEKVIPENIPQPGVFLLLQDFLEEMENRKKRHETLVIAYVIKLLGKLGYMPQLDRCIRCGSREETGWFDVREGGVLCGRCASDAEELKNKDSLIYHTGLSIIDVLEYLYNNPFSAFRNVALKEEMAEKAVKILKSYVDYHLDPGEIKSGFFLSGKYHI